MNQISKISALVAVFAATATFASAATIGSWATNTNSGAANSATPFSNTAVVYGGSTGVEIIPSSTLPTANTYAIPPNASWAAAGGGSQWVSFEPNTGSGGVVAPDAFYSYYSAFTGGSNNTLDLFVFADDTTDVYLNGVKLTDIHGGSGEAPGGNSTCQNNLPDCTKVDEFLVTGLNSGLNILEFDVDQTNLSSTGLDFYGTTSAAPTPEPSTLIMLGTGLIGSAGAMFRRMRK